MPKNCSALKIPTSGYWQHSLWCLKIPVNCLFSWKRKKKENCFLFPLRSKGSFRRLRITLYTWPRCNAAYVGLCAARLSAVWCGAVTSYSLPASRYRRKFPLSLLSIDFSSCDAYNSLLPRKFQINFGCSVALCISSLLLSTIRFLCFASHFPRDSCRSHPTRTGCLQGDLSLSKNSNWGIFYRNNTVSAVLVSLRSLRTKGKSSRER